MYVKASWSRMQRGPWPQPKRWSSCGSMVERQEQRCEGSKKGILNQYRRVQTNSESTTARPKFGLGMACNQELVNWPVYKELRCAWSQIEETLNNWWNWSVSKEAYRECWEGDCEGIQLGKRCLNWSKAKDIPGIEGGSQSSTLYLLSSWQTRGRELWQLARNAAGQCE